MQAPRDSLNELSKRLSLLYSSVFDTDVSRAVVNQMNIPTAARFSQVGRQARSIVNIAMNQKEPFNPSLTWLAQAGATHFEYDASYRARFQHQNDIGGKLAILVDCHQARTRFKFMQREEFDPKSHIAGKYIRDNKGGWIHETGSTRARPNNLNNVEGENRGMLLPRYVQEHEPLDQQPGRSSPIDFDDMRRYFTHVSLAKVNELVATIRESQLELAHHQGRRRREWDDFVVESETWPSTYEIRIYKGRTHSDAMILTFYKNLISITTYGKEFYKTCGTCGSYNSLDLDYTTKIVAKAKGRLPYKQIDLNMIIGLIRTFASSYQPGGAKFALEPGIVSAYKSLFTR